MNYDDHVLLFATTIILVSGDLSWSRPKKKQSCRKKRVVPKRKGRAEKKKSCRKERVVPKRKGRAEKKESCQKEKVVPKKRVVPEKTDVVKKKLDEKS